MPMQTLWLAWNPNPVGDNVLGYKAYVGPASRNYTEPGFPKDLGPGLALGGLLSGSIDIAADGRPRYVAISAYNAGGEGQVGQEIVLTFASRRLERTYP